MNKIKLIIIIVALSLTNCTQPKTHIEKEIIKYYSDKLHDPGSLEIVEIKKIDTIFTIDKINNDIEHNLSILKVYKNEEKKTRILDIEKDKFKIDSIKKGLISNDVESFKIYFSYRAKNKFGALILDDAVASMMYNEYSNNKSSYGIIYYVEN